MKLRKNERGYVIEAVGDRLKCDKRFLSVNPGCSDFSIGWRAENPNFDHQSWQIQDLGEEIYNLNAIHRSKCTSSALATRTVLDIIELQEPKVEALTQHVIFVPFSSEQEVFNFPHRATIHSLGKLDQNTYLSASLDCKDTQAYLTNRLNVAQVKTWNIVPSKSDPTLYNIIASDQRNCDRNYLSVGANCKDSYVDLWTRDDESGR